MRTPTLTCVFLCLGCIAEGVAGDDAVARLTVDPGESVRIDVPMSVELGPLDAADGQLTLFEVTGAERKEVPCQVVKTPAVRLCWILSGTTRPGEKRAYEIARGTSGLPAAVNVKDSEGAIEVICGGRPALRYNWAPVPPPKGASELYTRSGFIHPVWTPSGEVVTGIHPRDHIHHMGLWNPWTSTEFEGHHVDFWNLKEGQGTVRFREFASKTSGPVLGGFAAMQDHVDLKAAGGEKVALNEEFAVNVWSAGGTESGSFLLDVTTTQKCASASPLLLNAYRYGGLGFRATPAWKGGDYLTSEGLKRNDGHASRARWCEVHGPGNPAPSGVLFMSHPQNREHPEPVRLWPGDGELFFNFCPVQKTEWKLEPGNVYVLKYRVCVHNGPMTSETAERLWNDFANPPKAVLEKVGK
ncbi:MAG TPA: PmoA family protein [Candidatus Brocadiia bacterium]|nr:PmoA family protein [Candidatus Brocadiia bacterium]